MACQANLHRYDVIIAAGRMAFRPLIESVESTPGFDGGVSRRFAAFRIVWKRLAAIDGEGQHSAAIY